MLFISEDEVAQLLEFAELQVAMERALIELSSGTVEQPVRSVVRISQHQGWFGLMPAVYRDVIGTKLVTVFPANADRGLPTHNAVIQLFRAETGEPLAILGGRTITGLRTAAVSALATRELADENARVLAILGSGVQARTHYQAISRVRRFEDVRVWSRTPQNAARFAEEIGGRSVSAEEAVREADVIVTATHSAIPVVKGEWLKESAQVNAVGAVGLEAREIDTLAMTRGTVIVESREAALRESGEIVQSGASIYAELGEILAGTKPTPRGSLTIYKSLGVAVEDVAAARLVYQRAIERR